MDRGTDSPVLSGQTADSKQYIMLTGGSY